MLNFNSCIEWAQTNSELPDNLKPKTFLSSWDEHVLSWTKNSLDVPKLVLKYEDLVYKKEEVVKIIVKFFEKNFKIKFNSTKEKIANIVESTSFKKLKSQYYANYIRNPDLLYGFIIADFDNLYLYKFNEELLKNTDMSKSNNLDIKKYFTQDKIKLKSLMTKRWKIFSKQNLNNIYSHNAYSKSIYLKPSFKIIDYASKGYKKSVKGVNCNSNKLGQIISYIHKLEPKFKIGKAKNKRKMCNDLELLSRIKHNTENPDLTTPGITLYFLSPEEYYIWNYYQQ